MSTACVEITSIVSRMAAGPSRTSRLTMLSIVLREQDVGVTDTSHLAVMGPVHRPPPGPAKLTAPIVGVPRRGSASHFRDRWSAFDEPEITGHGEYMTEAQTITTTGIPFDELADSLRGQMVTR